MYNTNNLGWQLHCSMNTPIRDMATFMHECSDDPITRVMSTTAMYFALCQTAGYRWCRDLPSFLLVNAGTSKEDPIDEVVKHLVGLTLPGPLPPEEDFQRYRRLLLMMQDARQSLKNHTGPPTEKYRDLKESCDFHYNTYLPMAFGAGRAGWYADRFDESLGWITDHSCHTILRLERDKDRERFKQDLLEHPKRLFEPRGISRKNHDAIKAVSISGSMAASECAPHWVCRAIDESLPLLFLPHAQSRQLKLPTVQNVDFSKIFSAIPLRPGDKPRPEPTFTISLSWIGIALEDLLNAKTPQHEMNDFRLSNTLASMMDKVDRIRALLSFFPLDYNLAILKTLQKLVINCNFLTNAIVTPNVGSKERMQIIADLISMVLLGMSLSLEALGWYGYGYAIPGDRRLTLQMLETIRKQPGISKRDLQRKHQKLSSGQRDEILAWLSDKGLLTIDDTRITAVPFADYWKQIAERAVSRVNPPFWTGPLPLDAAAKSA